MKPQSAPISPLAPLTLDQIAAMMPALKLPPGDAMPSPAAIAAAVGPIHGWAVDLGLMSRLHGVAPLVCQAETMLAGLHDKGMLTSKEAKALVKLVLALPEARKAKAATAALATCEKALGASPSPVAAMLLGIGQNSLQRATILAAAGVGTIIVVDIVGGALGAWLGSGAGWIGAILGGLAGAAILSYIVI